MDHTRIFLNVYPIQSNIMLLFKKENLLKIFLDEGVGERLAVDEDLKKRCNAKLRRTTYKIVPWTSRLID